MAKANKVYEPGELDRVRKNLGAIDNDEARRMKEVLGGEIGLEKAEPSRIRQGPGGTASGSMSADLPSPLMQGSVDLTPDGSGTGTGEINLADESRFAARDLSLSPNPVFPVRQPYFIRLSMDFLSARPEFLLKTQFQALLGIFSIFNRNIDPVNAYFTNTLCSRAFVRIEAIPRRISTLLPARRKDVWTRMAQSRTLARILRALESLDAEGYSRELSKLQRSPRSVRVADLAPLARIVLEPLVRLRDAYTGLYVRAAIATAAAVSLEFFPDKKKEIEQARDELYDDVQYLFEVVRYSWYPLFMRLTLPEFAEYSGFYEDNEDVLVCFLKIKNSSIIACFGNDLDANTASELENLGDGKPTDEAGGDELERILETPEGDIAGAAIAGTGEIEGLEPFTDDVNALPPLGDASVPGGHGLRNAGSRFDRLPIRVREGLILFGKMFPQSGLDRLFEFPDLYRYFHALYDLPQSTDLISTRDSLLQIIVLTTVLNDLFYGFRAIRFGISSDEAGRDLEAEIHTILGNWTLPQDEIVAKRYLPMLSEYARLVETERETSTSSFASRRESDLRWMKRTYLLPYLKGAMFAGIKMGRERDVVGLHKQVALVSGALQGLVRDIGYAGTVGPDSARDVEFLFSTEDFRKKQDEAHTVNDVPDGTAGPTDRAGQGGTRTASGQVDSGSGDSSMNGPGAGTDAANEMDNPGQVASDSATRVPTGSSFSSPAPLPRLDSIGNPWDLTTFEVENAVSKRLRILLKFSPSGFQKLTNAKLVLLADRMVSVLDYLVNDETSWAYEDEGVTPYRSASEDSNARMDSISINPDALFNKSIEAIVNGRDS